MLADPRSESLVTNFAAQWLYLRDIDAKLPDEILFPDFDETLRQALRRETELFLDSILRENRSVLDLLTANYTFLNERLAQALRHPQRQGQRFPPRHASGRQPARRTARPGQHPDDHVVCDAHLAGPARQVGAGEPASSPPPPPPPDVPALKTEGRGAGQAADDARGDDPASRQPGVRQLPRAHGSRSASPWRTSTRSAGGATRDGGSPIDAVGVFPDGTTFDGIAGLKKVLLRPSGRVRRHRDREAADVCGRPQPAVL